MNNTIDAHCREWALTPLEAAPLAEKNGHRVLRCTRGDGGPCILKHFDDAASEPALYALLHALGVPTLPLLARSDNALLLPDLNTDAAWRLGTPSDLADVRVIRALADWYRELHARGSKRLCESALNLSSENDALTAENFRAIADKTQTIGAPFWGRLEAALPLLRQAIEATERTLCYNDFFHTNLAVARDGARALCFDYDQMGIGYAYADVRNVCSSLPPDACAAFLSAYGALDEGERLLDDVAAPLVTLHVACRRAVFPSWARDALAQIADGRLDAALKALLAHHTGRNATALPRKAAR